MPKFSPNPEATREENFTDHRSYVSFRLHPGSTHACVYLKGDDVEQVRSRIFKRSQGCCCECGAYYGWEDGHLHHVHGGSASDRCWCDENLVWICPKCHLKEHGMIPIWERK